MKFMEREFNIMTNARDVDLVGRALADRGYVDSRIDSKTREFVHARNGNKRIDVDLPDEPALANYKHEFAEDPKLIQDPRLMIAADAGAAGGTEKAIKRREREMLADMRHVEAYLAGKNYGVHLYQIVGKRPSSVIVQDSFESL